MISKLIWVLILFSNFSYAQNLLSLCEEKITQNNSNCLSVTSSLPIALDKNGLEVYSKWAWLKEKLDESTAMLDAEIKSNKDMLYYYRSDFVDEKNSRAWFEEKFTQDKNDYLDLRLVMAQIGKMIFQLNNCQYCSAYSRVEKEKELERLNALKLSLLSKNPFLASAEFEENIVNNQVLDDKSFKETMAKGYSSYLTNLDTQRQAANNYLEKKNSQYEFLMSSRPTVQVARQEYFMTLLNDKDFVENDYISNFLLSLNWDREIEDPVFGKVACEFLKENHSYQKNKKVKDISFDVTMFVAPFVLSPIARLGVWGLRGAGIVKWGIRGNQAQKIVAASQGAISSFYFLDSISDIHEKREVCNNKLSNFIKDKNDNDYKEAKKCHDEVDDILTMAIIESSVVGFQTIAGVKGVLNFVKNYDHKNKLLNVKNIDELNLHLSKDKFSGTNIDESGFVYKSAKDGDFYALNLAHTPKAQDLKFLGGDYWNFVSDIYSKRLNLSKEEISNFITSSKEMAPRTSLIVNTASNSKDKFKGGVALVTSKSSAEKMPFEKATGFEVQREKGKRVAEIVRLTVDEKTADRTLVDKLIESVLATVKGEKDIDKIYVYTSKIHARLYRKFGIPLKEVHKSHRDVILEIDLTQVEL